MLFSSTSSFSYPQATRQTPADYLNYSAKGISAVLSMRLMGITAIPASRRDCCPPRYVPETGVNRGINHAAMAYHPQLRDGAMPGPRGGINEIVGRAVLEANALRANAGAGGNIHTP